LIALTPPLVILACEAGCAGPDGIIAVCIGSSSYLHSLTESIVAGDTTAFETLTRRRPMAWLRRCALWRSTTMSQARLEVSIAYGDRILRRLAVDPRSREPEVVVLPYFGEALDAERFSVTASGGDDAERDVGAVVVLRPPRFSRLEDHVQQLLPGRVDSNDRRWPHRPSRERVVAGGTWAAGAWLVRRATSGRDGARADCR
jgi:hypothetical protein